VVVIVGLTLGLTLGTGSSAPLPGFTISLSTGTVANSDSIIVSDKTLQKSIPAHIHWVPFTAGVTAVAEMKSGSLQSISGVGNPPTVGAIGTGTGIDIVMAQSFDSDELLVPASALDAITRLRMHEFLLGIWRQYRMTIIFVTHDIEESVLLADRVAVMGGRPPTIQQVIDVPLERRREADDVDTTEFLTIKREIRSSLAI
jgi:hypothetical protein